MTGTIMNSNFSPQPEHINAFRKKGFTKLENFLTSDTINYLKDRINYELSNSPGNFQTEFNRLKYDFETRKDVLYSLINQHFFQNTLTELTGRTLFFTFEICFELKKNESQGFPWHVGVQSFGYQKAEDFGCTIWIPLHPIDTEKQGGGMQYVPKNVVSGRFVYDDIEPALVSAMEKIISKGLPVSLSDYFSLRTGALNSPAMLEILEQHKEEDNFNLGDVLAFDKYVIHKSVKLDEGAIEKRAAFVMRFIDIDSRYDLRRAQNIEFPSRQFGYKAFTRSHLEIGRKDNELFSESSYFDEKEKRIISPPKLPRS